MRSPFSKLAFTAGITLAVAFTLSCSDDKNDDNPSGSSSPSNSGVSSSSITGDGNLSSSSSSDGDINVSSSSAGNASLSSSSITGDGNSSSSSSDGGENGSISYEGKDYKIVKIGNQWWMAENLNYNVNGSKCYNNQDSNCAKYGRLYDWATAMALPSSCNASSCASQIIAKHKGICPDDWHIPSGTDWNVLMKFINPNCSDNSSCIDAGTKLKSTSGWDENGNGTDDFDFAALPGGYGGSRGDFIDVDKRGYWWSASEGDAGYVISREMKYDSKYVSWYSTFKDDLFSVRCVQN